MERKAFVTVSVDVETFGKLKRIKEKEGLRSIAEVVKFLTILYGGGENEKSN